MDGIGFVMTSSPTSSTRDAPVGDQDSTAAPSVRHDSSPSQTGTSGAEPTNAVHRSVPPDTEQICTDAPSDSAIHWKPSGLSGAPVEPSAFSDVRSLSFAGVRPCFRQDWMYGAEVPKYVTLCRAARRHNVPRSGWPGLPSYITTVAPTSRPEMR